MRPRPFPSSLVAILLALSLVACGDRKEAPAATPAAPPAAPNITLATLDSVAKDATGFNVGSTMAARTVYVFFDPQCPHCAALWESARPLKAQARFVWIPVALLNERSGPQGATILAAADPVATMDQHEALLKNKQGGIPAAANIDAQKKAVEANTALLNRLGFGGVPGVLSKNAITGQLVNFEGAAPTDELARRLGLNP